MPEDSRVEAFFDYIDFVSHTLYDHAKVPYLRGVEQSLGFSLNRPLEYTLADAAQDSIDQSKQEVLGMSLSREEARKAVQLALLKGFKHERITNAMVTPDVLGIFMAYLVRRLFSDKKVKSVLDPLVGTGNLVAAFANHYENVKLYGVDSDAMLCNIALYLTELLGMQAEITHQDTLGFQTAPVDLILTDLPVESVDRRHTYFPYQVILHHLEHLKAEGFFLAVVENDFFEQEEVGVFKDQLFKLAHLYGLLKLDETLFQNHPKSILILKKKKHEGEEHVKDFLLANLPPFTDEASFKNAMQKIDNFFNKKRG